MNLFESAVLGVVQGLTEYLPVSSSGHLVIVQSLLQDFKQPGVLFDVALHVGTIFAVVLYFKKNILNFDPRTWGLLLVGTIPAGIAGILFKDFTESLFSIPRFVGFALLVTGLINWMTDKEKTDKSSKSITFIDALFIGVFQAIAIIPGISRSGSTIFAGVLRGIKREDAAAFSFLLSIPAIAGATFLQTVSHSDSNSISIANYFVGMVFAFITGYLSIGLLMKVLISRKFKLFAIYCFIVGITTIFYFR